jgi:hypothetical protein
MELVPEFVSKNQFLMALWVALVKTSLILRLFPNRFRGTGLVIWHPDMFALCSATS